MASQVHFLVPHYYREGGAGSYRTNAIKTALEELKFEVTLILPNIDLRSGEEILDKPKSIGRTQIHWVKCTRNLRRSAFARLLFELSYFFGATAFLFRQKCNIVIASYPPAFGPLVGLTLKLLRPGCTFTVEIRDLMAGALASTEYLNNRFLLKVAKIYERIIFRSSDFLILASPGMREFISKNNQVKIIRCYNGWEDSLDDLVIPDMPSEDAQCVYRKVNTLPGYYVIYAGALTQSYDLITLIRGYKKSQIADSGIQFLILGEGDKKEEYRQLVNKESIRGVVFHDFVPRKIAFELIGNARAGLHAFDASPHWRYVSGNKLFDYMAASINVIFAGDGASADLVRGYSRGVLVAPCDVQSLANRLRSLASAPYCIADKQAVELPPNYSRSHQIAIFKDEWARALYDK